MVCDATYKKINEIEDEQEESREQHGFKSEREYLDFLLEQERQWETEHPAEIVPASGKSDEDA